MSPNGVDFTELPYGDADTKPTGVRFVGNLSRRVVAAEHLSKEIEELALDLGVAENAEFIGRTSGVSACHDLTRSDVS